MPKIHSDPCIEIGPFFDPGYSDPYHRKAHVFVNGRVTVMTVSYYGDGSHFTVTKGVFNTLGHTGWNDWTTVAEIIEREISK